MGEKSRERGMPIKLTKQGSEKCQDATSESKPDSHEK